MEYEGITWTNAGSEKIHKVKEAYEPGDENPYAHNSNFVWAKNPWGTYDWYEKEYLTEEMLEDIREYQLTKFGPKETPEEKAEREGLEEEEQARLDAEYLEYLLSQPPSYCYKDGSLDDWKEKYGVSA